MEKNTKKFKIAIFCCSDDEEIKFSFMIDGYEAYTMKKTFEGAINNLENTDI